MRIRILVATGDERARDVKTIEVAPGDSFTFALELSKFLDGWNTPRAAATIIKPVPVETQAEAHTPYLED